jgi:hypothetical protein
LADFFAMQMARNAAFIPHYGFLLHHGNAVVSHCPLLSKPLIGGSERDFGL